MKKKFVIVIILLFGILLVNAQTKLTVDSVMAKVAKGKNYTLVFLKSGKKIPTKSQAAQQMQVNHLVNLFNMEAEGKISIFGPVTNDPKLRGIIVFNSTDQEYIKSELNKDPYINAGYLKYEMLNWFSIPGQKIAN
jgi:hypothetical protein